MNIETLLSSTTLLAFVLVTSLGVFSGGLWAVAAYAAAVFLFGLSWRLAYLQPVPERQLPKTLKVAAVAAGILGAGALLYFAPALLRNAGMIKRLAQGIGRGRVARAVKLFTMTPPVLRKYLPKLIALHPAMHPGGSLLPQGPAMRAWRRMPKPRRGFTRLALIALLVMLLNLCSSTLPLQSLRMIVQLASIFLPLLLLTGEGVIAAAGHPRLFLWLPVLATVRAALLAAELQAGAPLLHAVRGANADPAGYNRGASYLVILSLPLMAGLWYGREWDSRDRYGRRREWRSRWLLFPLITALLFLGQQTESRAAKLALLLALLALASACLLPRVTRWALAALPFIALIWPFAARSLLQDHADFVARLPPSWQARVEIWDYLSYRVAEHPLLGWGLNTAQNLAFQSPHSALYAVTTHAAAHPHNVVIQLWVELGLPGLALGLAFALYVLGRVKRLDPRLQPFALGSYLAALTFCFVSFNFWTDSIWACFALTGLLFRLLEQRLDAGTGA